VEFKGKVVAITGAAGGIGQALSRYFGAEGACIAAIDKSDKVKEFARTLAAEGINADSAVLDIADDEAVAKAFEKFKASLGATDILVNNAGFSGVPTLEVTSPADFRRLVEGNVSGAFYCTHAVLPAMKSRRSGVIVNIGSINGFSALGDPAYSVGKAGLFALTQALAMEYGRFGIRANMVAPGTVRTPIWAERMERNPEVLKQLTRWYPLRRVVEPIDVARAVGFLASEAAAAISGVVLPVDCGASAGNIVMARELTLEDF
jgi:NAD(P)-dependent dehydrogenase (short-subunit alcohol dehydrogenase family)